MLITSKFWMSFFITGNRIFLNALLMVILISCLMLNFDYNPRFNEVERGVYWYHLVRLSVCLSVRLSVRPSVDRIVSALYLQQYSSDPFHICTSYQATSEGVSRAMPVSKFNMIPIWIQYDSMVWVIMRRWGVSSERRRSSCSSFDAILT